MKKVCDYQQLIYIKGRMNVFSKVSVFRHLMLLSDKEVTKLTSTSYFATFEELLKAVQNNKIWNAEVGHTCILKRPKVCITCGLSEYYITKRNFTEVYLMRRFEDASDEPMKVLMEELPADEFAEYLRERNI